MKVDVLNAEQTRRDLLARMGTGLVAITVSTAMGQASPQEARARGEALRKLSVAEGRTFEAFGDTLLPGAARPGQGDCRRGRAARQGCCDRQEGAADEAPEKHKPRREGVPGSCRKGGEPGDPVEHPSGQHA